MSRAVFARRFMQSVGEPPLTYVTRWRMGGTTFLLKQGEHIATMAHQVGYDNDFVFAKTLRLARGVASAVPYAR
ncbi:MAG: hypothetical protein ACR2OU_12240 [Thermomicrobiales bacterium]